ncbi:MAG: DUF429 domain-containing protein [Deltaproteobacteria bacterium]|nr:DUF429 domain-containing protein [Deltaproteobacteria bacterium]
MKWIGADGCRRGWFTVVFDKKISWEVEIFETIDALWEHHRDAGLILLDIPIGLPFSRQRQCDVTARRLLRAPRASSVFPAPCRPAVYAEKYESACEENRRVLRAGLSIQSWCISKKIREVDEFLGSTPEAREIIRESHPEVCFWAFAGGRAMARSKKKREGQEGRLDILSTIYPGAKEIRDKALEEYKRKDVGMDDILDALVLALTASEPQHQLSTIPPTPPKDEKGLPMEIVFSKRMLKD